VNDDDLRASLGRLDPAAAAEPVHRAGSPRARHVMETVMATPLDVSTDTDPASPSRESQSRRGRWVALAAAAGVAAIVATAAVVASDDSASKPPAPQQQALVLNAPGAAAGGGGTTMASCMMFDVEILKQMPVAFGGTVTSVAARTVTFDVDRWFTSDSGRPDRVEVRTADDASIALDGVEFTEGSRYLVTATEGNVNTCGFSGPATRELEASFEEAFPG